MDLNIRGPKCLTKSVSALFWEEYGAKRQIILKFIRLLAKKKKKKKKKKKTEADQNNIKYNCSHHILSKYCRNRFCRAFRSADI